MTTAFIPGKKDLFFIKYKPKTGQYNSISGDGVVTVNKSSIVDYSFRSDIFLCEASSTTHIIGKHIHSESYGTENKSRIFPCDLTEFMPVSPEIMHWLKDKNKIEAEFFKD